MIVLEKGIRKKNCSGEREEINSKEN